MSDDKNTTATPDQSQVSNQQNSGGSDQSALIQALQKQVAATSEANQALKQQLDDVVKSDANKSGDLKKVLKLEQEAKSKLQAKYDELKGMVINNKIKSEIAAKAKDLHNVDAFLKIVGTDKISIVDNNVYGVDEIIKEARQSHPFLFKIQDVNAGPKTSPVTTSQADKDKGYLEELKTVNTQQQLTDLQKKYNVKDKADGFNFGVQ